MQWKKRERASAHHRTTALYYNHIHTWECLVSHQPDLHVFSLWEEPGAPGGQSHEGGENTQAPHKLYCHHSGSCVKKAHHLLRDMK